MILSYLIKGELITTNQSNEDLEIIEEYGRYNVIKVKALKDITLNKAEIKDIASLNPDDIFILNGYQSWTYTKEYTLNDQEFNIKKIIKPIRKAFYLETYGDSFIYDYHKNKLHGFDIFYIKGKKELFSVNLNFKNAYLIYDIDRINKTLSLISDVEGLTIKEGETKTLFNYSLFDSINEGMDDFRRLFPKKDTPKLFGYSSWYNYYQHINESIILRDLESLDDRFNLCQIDDGYQEYVGDWTCINKEKFPNGLKKIVDKIHEKGKRAGIWVAPFAAESKSKIFNEHPEYFTKDGKLLKAGSNWSGFYSIDLDNVDAKQYIKSSLEYLMDLGFDFFKLDFLYIASLFPYTGKTHAMVAREAYEFLQGILKDKLILGCGAIVSSSAGLFDYLRIGPDVTLEMDNNWFIRMLHHKKLPIIVTLQNTIYRSLFNHYMFLNDPDVFILRHDNTSISEAQKEALVLINSMFSGLLLTSDNIASYDEGQNKLLDMAYDIFNNAKNQSFIKDGNRIDISYVLNDKEYKFIYDTKKGVLVNGKSS